MSIFKDNFKTQSSPSLFLEARFHVFPTGTKGKILIINVGPNGTSYLYHSNENQYECIGPAPSMLSDWKEDLKMCKIDESSTDNILTFFACSTHHTENDRCYIVTFNSNTRKIEWKNVSSNYWDFCCIDSAVTVFGSNHLLLVPGFNYDTHNNQYGFFGGARIISGNPWVGKMLSQRDVSTQILSVDMENGYAIDEIERLPFEVCNPKLINITRNCEIIKNNCLLFVENKALELSNAKRFMTFIVDVKDGFHNLEIKAVETKMQHNICFLDYFLFNDYLIAFGVNQCHIFSFEKMDWISSFTLQLESLDMILKRTVITINCGIVHMYAIVSYFRQTKTELKHYTFDVGNTFNNRYQTFYAIMCGLQKHKYVHVKEMSKLIFNFIDDGFVVRYFHKPWDIYNDIGAKRHAIWYVMESMVDDHGSSYSLQHTINFMKTLFDYTDEINSTKHNLYKPWYLTNSRQN
eukprot:516311_1